MPWPTEDLSRTPAEVRVKELEDAIREVVTQEMDDLCWMDVYTKLGRLVGVEFDPATLPAEVMLANCRRFVTALKAGRPYVPGRLSTLLAEARELRAGFELRWKADLRAVERWRAAGPGRELTMPDHADLCVWLLEKLAEAEAGADLKEIDHQNIGSDLAAEKLLEIVRAGEHRGTFGSEKMEACARAVLALHERLRKAEAKAAELEAIARARGQDFYD
jgi:hypothetical protein